MKQHIEIEQLKELSKEQIKVLTNFMQDNPRLIRIAYPKYFQIAESDYIEAVHLINIGKMIEVLNKYIPKTSSIEDSLDIECDRVTEAYLVEYRKSNFEFAEFEDKELCDALWKAVKSLLKTD